MTIQAWPVKAPDSVVRDFVPLNDLIGDNQAQPVSASFTAAPSGTGELQYDDVEVDARSISVLLSQGVPGRTYTGTLELHLSDGTAVQRFLSIPIDATDAVYPVPEPPSYNNGTAATWGLALTASQLTAMVDVGKIFFVPTTNALPPNNIWRDGALMKLSASSTILPISPVSLPPGTLWLDGNVVSFAGGTSTLPTSPVGLLANYLWNNVGALYIIPPPS